MWRLIGKFHLICLIEGCLPCEEPGASRSSRPADVASALLVCVFSEAEVLSLRVVCTLVEAAVDKRKTLLLRYCIFTGSTTLCKRTAVSSTITSVCQSAAEENELVQVCGCLHSSQETQRYRSAARR